MEIAVTQADALTFGCDVLVLKYAQQLYGVDQIAIDRLESKGIHLHDRLPKPGDWLLVESAGAFGAAEVLFVGVPHLVDFGYEEIRDFSTRALAILTSNKPQATHIAFTLHGPGYGLDETEAFYAEVGGFFDADQPGQGSVVDRRVTLVENDPGRAVRLQELLLGLDEAPKPRADLTSGSARPVRMGTFAGLEPEKLRSAGASSRDKAHIFVAMPFAPAFDDRFHYGIQSAVHSAGYLCERADLSSFTGDVIAWVKQRITNAHMLIADLSTANPNVYLEVGFAWGIGVRTILIAENAASLKFDVQGQRCLIYEGSIRRLEENLAAELKALRHAP